MTEVAEKDGYTAPELYKEKLAYDELIVLFRRKKCYANLPKSAILNYFR